MSKEQQDKYITLAKRALGYIKSILIFGSNSKAGSEVPGWNPERALALRQLIQIAKAYILATHGPISQDENNNIATLAMKKFQYGQCEEQARAAFKYLKKLIIKEHFACVLDLCITTIGGHTLIVIDSQPFDTGNQEDAVICDPWAEKVYPLSQFEVMQRPENDVKYAKQCYDGRPLPHYLAGTLISIHSYDNTESVPTPTSTVTLSTHGGISLFEQVLPWPTQSASASSLEMHAADTSREIGDTKSKVVGP